MLREFGPVPAMITVHHLNNSRSHRVLWLLEELGVPYEIRRYERDPRTSLAPAELRANLERIVAHVESDLGKEGWFAGSDFSSADIQMSFPVEAIAARVGARPNITRFLQRMHDRPAYRRAVERGGEVAILS